MRPKVSADRWSCGLALAAVGAAVAAAAPPAAPQDHDLPFTLADLTLGTHVSGDNLSTADLEHHVVLLAFWTQATKAGQAGMPLLEQAHRALSPTGLRVVGIHVDRGAVPEVHRAALNLGLTFPVFDDGEVKGLDDPEPPSALLFDHTGKCLAHGPLGDMATRAAAASAVAPPVVLAGRRLEQLAAFEHLLRDEAKYGIVLRKLEALSDDEDRQLADEARYLGERLREHGERLLTKAEAVKSSDALEAAALLHRAASAYRGDEIGKRAADCQRAWKRDKAFNDGLQAAGLTAQLEALRSQALARPSPRQPRAGGLPAVAGMNAATGIPPPLRAQMSQLAALVLQLSPGSKHAARAEQIILELGLGPVSVP